MPIAACRLLWVAHFNSETDGTIEVELVSSRDGKQWLRAEPQEDGARPKLIQRGPAAWDGMMVHTSTHPLLINDTLHLYCALEIHSLGLLMQWAASERCCCAQIKATRARITMASASRARAQGRRRLASRRCGKMVGVRSPMPQKRLQGWC